MLNRLGAAAATLTLLAGLTGLTVSGIPSGPAAEAAGQGPYGLIERKNEQIKMADGITLRANVKYPARGGRRAPGSFPVVVTETPYGKDLANIAGELAHGPFGRQFANKITPNGREVLNELSDAAGYSGHLVEHGYIHVQVDVRGTGVSEGEWSLLQPVETRDSIRVVDWASRLPGSNGRVGMVGLSYLGMTQMLAAGAVGPGSPLKAIFPIMPGVNVYQDLVAHDGLFNIESTLSYLGGSGTMLQLLNPLLGLGNDPKALQKIYQDRFRGFYGSKGEGVYGMLGNLLTNQNMAYDEKFWQDRATGNAIDKIVANGIPAYLVGGLFDVLQDGTPRAYAGLQNAWAGRPSTGPMAPDQPVTGRYQLLNGPWYHLTPGYAPKATVDLKKIQLAWFDRWLKGERNGIDATRTPLHAIDVDGHHIRAATYPLKQAKPTTFYLGDRTLDRTPPAARTTQTTRTTRTTRTGRADQVAYTGLSNPCSRSTEQWIFGLPSLLLNIFKRQNPCAQHVPAPTAERTYSTGGFTAPTVLAGPIGLTLYARSTKPNTAFVATVDDVAPDGTAVELTSGSLLGTFRALDERRTWRTSDGRILSPYHLDTRAALRPVAPGRVIRYDLKIRATFHTFQPGHRLRIRLGTGDLPHVIPPPWELPNLLGGVYQVQRSGDAPSQLIVPLATPRSTAG